MSPAKRSATWPHIPSSADPRDVMAQIEKTLIPTRPRAANRRHGQWDVLSRPTLPLILGLGMAIAYTFFGVLAYVHYPHVYSPLHNTLSQLGNSNLNPHGAVFYLIGCAVGGALVMAFFASLGHWKRTGTPLQNRLLLLMQALGAVGGFGLLMNAVFPENQLPAHHFWAGVVFNSLGAAMLLSPFTFRRPNLPHLGVLVVPAFAVAAVVLMYVFAPIHLFEWPPVTVFLISPILLGFHTRGVAILPSPHQATEIPGS
ncbi:MAG TPA: DUF998 domain-containing protein [Chloroflexota bacterium]